MTAVEPALTLAQVKPDGIYTVKEVAELFRFDVSTVGYWIRSKKLKAIELFGTRRISGAEIIRLACPTPAKIETKTKRNKRGRDSVATLKTAKS